MATITKTINQPEAVINAFADDLGYQTVVANPDYVPAQNAETIDDTTQPMALNQLGIMVYPQIPNPDYIAQVGEPTIPNPQSRVKFVSDKFDDFVADKFFGQFARRNAERAALATIEETVQATKEAIKQTIVTT